MSFLNKPTFFLLIFFTVTAGVVIAQKKVVETKIPVKGNPPTIDSLSEPDLNLDCPSELDTVELPYSGYLEKSPMRIKSFDGIFPHGRRDTIEGIVWVRVLISKEGNVSKAELARSDYEIFNELAVATALKWKFTPALATGGKPVGVWVTIPIRISNKAKQNHDNH